MGKITAYFTFGQGHQHVINQIYFGPNTIAKITSEDPREDMFAIFGSKWAFQYEKIPSLRFFSEARIIDLNEEGFIDEKKKS